MRFRFAILIFVTLSASSLLAHHSVGSSNDSSRLVTIHGTVSRVQWTNPHVWITLTITDADGRKVSEERVQIAAPGRLMKLGVDQTFLKIGDVVTFEAWPPKVPGAAPPNGRTLIVSNGRRVDVSDAWPDRVPAAGR
jgi:hypothetical protein